MMKSIKYLLLVLALVGLAVPLIGPSAAFAVPVSYTGYNSQYTEPLNGIIAGFYNLNVDGEQILGICDDYQTHIVKTWDATFYTHNDIQGGAGTWSLEQYNNIGYLFMKTYDAMQMNDNGAELAAINAAIWKVTYGGLALSGRAAELYGEVFDGTNYIQSLFTGWHGYMNILTPNPLKTSQEMLIQAAPVPESATMLLLGTGLIGLAGVGRKRLLK